MNPKDPNIITWMNRRKKMQHKSSEIQKQKQKQKKKKKKKEKEKHKHKHKNLVTGGAQRRRGVRWHVNTTRRRE
jgi:hypothetical protein